MNYPCCWLFTEQPLATADGLSTSRSRSDSKDDQLLHSIPRHLKDSISPTTAFISCILLQDCVQYGHTYFFLF